MAKSKRGGKAYVGYYAKYKSGNVEARNRKDRLTKLALENPNNLQLEEAIKNIRHRRFTPKAPYWSHSMIRIAKIVKDFTGKFNKNYFSTDPDSHSAALRSRNENKFKQLNIVNPKGSMFSLGERIGWKF